VPLPLHLHWFIQFNLTIHLFFLSGYLFLRYEFTKFVWYCVPQNFSAGDFCIQPRFSALRIWKIRGGFWLLVIFLLRVPNMSLSQVENACLRGNNSKNHILIWLQLLVCSRLEPGIGGQGNYPSEICCMDIFFFSFSWADFCITLFLSRSTPIVSYDHLMILNVLADYFHNFVLTFFPCNA